MNVLRNLPMLTPAQWVSQWDQRRSRRLGMIILCAVLAFMGYTIAFHGKANAEGPVAGFWIGAHAGASMANTALNVPGHNLVDGLGAESTTPLYGVRAGMDLQVPGSVVFVGPFATYTMGETKLSVLDGAFSASLKNSWSVGGRVGTTVGSAKPYVLAAYRQTDMSWTDLGQGSAPTLHGYDLGAGIAIPLDKNLEIGLEGIWTKYQSHDLCGGCGFSMDTDQLSVLAFLNFKFGGPEEAKAPAAKANKIKP